MASLAAMAMRPTSVSAEAASGAGAAPRGALVRLRVAGPDGRKELQVYPGLSESEAVRRAVAAGGRVLAIETEVPEASPTPGSARGGLSLLLFSQELLALLEAGLQLTEALATLRAKERRDAAARLLDAVLADLRAGRNFSDALAAHPGTFPPLYVATIRASERSGGIPQALARFIAYQVQLEGIRKRLIAASIYPLLLLVIGSFVALFLLGFVVPRFADVYLGSGREMPWASAWLFRLGSLFNQHLGFGLTLVAVGIAASVALVFRPGARRRAFESLLRLPRLAEQADVFRLARFYRALGLLLTSGIALPKALGMSGDLLGLRQQEGLARTRAAIDQGQSLSAALRLGGLSTPVADSLVRVGESSGQLAGMLERTAAFHDDEFARWVDWSSRLLEPVLMAAMGLVIGAIVVLMYLPIFELSGSLR